MQDGGVTAIAWYGYDLPAETPTVVIMHTITGTPESMRELVKDLHEYTGWRIALCLRRGHAGLPMPVPQISLFGSTHDLREQLTHLQNLFPDSGLYAVGSSAGTGLLVRYLGEQGESTPFKAAFAMCPGYNTELSFKNVHPFYSKMMTKKLFKYFIHPYQNTWSNIASLKKVLTTTSLEEFEKEQMNDRDKGYIRMRSIMDFGMGLLWTAMGVFLIFVKKFNTGLETRYDESTLITFGSICLLYGLFRIYRGYKKNYLRERYER